MTTLAITPNWKNKTAKFKGTIAAGEHVAVTIQNDNGEGTPFIEDASTLRLRVVDPCNGRTLAIFPEPVPEGETPEEWDSDLSPLRCTLNLNTVQMLKAVPPAANVPLLFVLDDYENKTLYFKEQFPVEHWPRLRGEEEPTDLDNYKDIIADFNTRLDGFGSRITAAENVANAATENASAAAERAASAAATANNAIAIAQDAKSGASDSALAAHNSALAAEEAQEAAESAAESINSPDATLTEEGVAAEAKATGESIAAEETRAKAAEAAEESRAKAAESALAANVSSAQKAISDEAELRAAADADLNANKADKTAVAAISADVAAAQAAIVTKADKATTYTKSEVDAKVAGVQTFQKLVVNELPSAEAADYKTIYLVPRAGSETPDLCDEYTVVGDVGARRWEKIGGGTAVDITLDNAVTNASAHGVKSSGIWSAIWGALTAVPGFSSLYDWCVAQLAGKASTADATLTPIYSDTPTFSEWAISPSGKFDRVTLDTANGWLLSFDEYYIQTYNYDPNATSVSAEDIDGTVYTATRTRTDIIGYTLGSQTDKPLQPKGDYAPATNIAKSALAQNVQASLDKADTALQKTGGTMTGDLVFSIATRGIEWGTDLKLNKYGLRIPDLPDAFGISWPNLWNLTANDTLALVSQIPSVAGLAPLASPAFTGTPTAPTPTAGDDSTKVATTAFVKTAVDEVPLRYNMPAAVALVAENDAATLVCADRAVTNTTIATGFSTLNLTFPDAISGKVRDFYLRITVAAGESAPALSIPQGITIENPDGAVPEIADGGTDAASTTLVWFSETAPNVFTAKSETVKAVA